MRCCSDVIIEKHYKGVTSRASVEIFWEEVNKRSKRDVSRGGRFNSCIPSTSDAELTARLPDITFTHTSRSRCFMQDVPPVLVTPKYYLVSIYRNGLYFLATLNTEVRGLWHCCTCLLRGGAQL